jgi:hypothetical protein
MSGSDSVHKRPRAAFLALVLAAAALGTVVLTPPPAAAALGDPQPASDAESRLRKLQALLGELELYRGPIDGKPSAQLSAALASFAQATGQPLGSEASDALFDALESHVRSKRLGRFLDTLGREQAAQAREALLSQPATRDLVTPPDSAPADAPPAGSVFACVRAPAADCLIAAAVEAGQAVSEARMRDWALGEIVKAQARAGADAEARTTIRRIADARQIIVSLRDLASVQADRRDLDQARATATSIPDPLARVEADLAIATRLLDRGDPTGARLSLARAEGTLSGVGEPLQRVAQRARIASLRWRAEDRDGADAALAEAERDTRRLAVRDSRATGFGFIVTALGEMGRAAEAARLIADQKLGDEAPAALAATASAAARAHDPTEADRIAALITEPRFRALALVQLAVIAGRQAETARAGERLAEAIRITRAIDEPGWRDFPLSRIAQGWLDLKQPDQALEPARAIGEATLRARVLFAVAHAQAALGEDAAATVGDAERAAAAVASPLDQCWMLTEVALGFAQAGDKSAAQAMLQRAVEIAAAIQDPASRARAFSRVASVLLEI